MSRGVSTVVDALVFLLLVSLAATTLVAPQSPEPAPSADEPARVVSRTTASVSYSLVLGPGDGSERPHREEGVFERHAHGRLAGLLTRAAVRNTTVDGTQLTHASDGFERAVTDATANTTAPRTHVVATWSPYEGSAVVGRVTAGTAPPPTASVTTRTLTVETRASDAGSRALVAANRSGYAGVAQVLSRATVRVLLPREGMANALAADYPTDRLAARRYRSVAALVGVNVSEAVARGDARAANAWVRAAFAARFERQLRERFGSPTEAARAVRVGTVRLVVRRWSA